MSRKVLEHTESESDHLLLSWLQVPEWSAYHQLLAVPGKADTCRALEPAMEGTMYKYIM